MRLFFVRSHGYSLIEIILIILILAIAIPPIINIFSQNLVHNVNSEAYTKAVLYAEEKMEEILSAKRAYSYSYVLAEGRYPEDSPETGFSRQVIINDSGTMISGIPYAEITVTVSHANINDVQLTSWITDYE